MKKSIALLIVVLMVVSMSLVSCSTTTTTTAPTTAATTAATTTAAPTTAGPTTTAANKKPLVVFQSLGSVAPYVAGMVRAYEPLAEKYGWDFVIIDGKADALQNAKDMETAVSMNPDLIISMSIDVAATAASYKKAWEAGIPVVIDTIAVLPEDEKYTVAYSGPNDYDHGVAVAEMMNEALKGEGNVVILTTPPGQSTTNLRMQGFTETLAKLGSKIKILGVNNNDNMKDKAITVMQDFITQFGDDIDAVYAMEDYGAMGAQIALKEAGFNMDEIVIIGVGGSAEGLKAVKDGLIYGTTLQAPSIACAQAAALIDSILENGIKPPQQNPTYFNYITLPKVTKENVDQYLPGEW